MARIKSGEAVLPRRSAGDEDEPARTLRLRCVTWAAHSSGYSQPAVRAA